MHDSWFASEGGGFLPWVGLSTNEHITRNLLTLGELDNSIAKAIAAPKLSVDSLANVVLGNH